MNQGDGVVCVLYFPRMCNAITNFPLGNKEKFIIGAAVSTNARVVGISLRLIQ